MNILIVGCSRLGAALACALSNRGHDVAVMDKRSDSFERLDESFTGLTSKGVPIDNDDLEAAGIESCDVVCAVTENDNENIMVAQIAGEVYKIPKVLAGIKDPDKEWVFQQCGLKTICSSPWMPLFRLSKNIRRSTAYSLSTIRLSSTQCIFPRNISV